MKLFKPTCIELLPDGIKITDLSSTYMINRDNINYVRSSTFTQSMSQRTIFGRRRVSASTTSFMINVKEEKPEYYKGLNKITRFTRRLSPGVSSKDIIINTLFFDRKLTVDDIKNVYPEVQVGEFEF